MIGGPWDVGNRRAAMSVERRIDPDALATES